MTLKQTIQKRGVTKDGLAMELRMRKEQGTFLYHCLKKFSSDDIRAELKNIERG